MQSKIELKLNCLLCPMYASDGATKEHEVASGTMRLTRAAARASGEQRGRATRRHNAGGRALSSTTRPPCIVLEIRQGLNTPVKGTHIMDYSSILLICMWTIIASAVFCIFAVGNDC